MPSNTSLKITEIFYSIQGESLSTGQPTVFVRLTGCPLRCTYCDTAYAFHGGERQTFESILSTIQSYPSHWVTITGGEPLAQPPVKDLMRMLCDQSYHVSLETSGAIDVKDVDPRVVKVMDIKLPGSGENHRHLTDNYAYLQPHDQIKCVIANREDYEWARDHIQSHPLLQQSTILFSPCTPGLDCKALATWILEDGLNVRLQIQLHKFIWEDARGK